jgi:hypothetical protein
LLGAALARAQHGPQTVVREFCRLDAMGARVTLQGWPQVAPLVAWLWEPAWDRVVLVSSYTVGWPVPEQEGSFSIEVRYAVQGTITANGLREETSVESRIFHVVPDSTGAWRIAAPPPPPHIFVHHVDPEAMRRSLLAGGVNFVANSTFVNWLYRDAGWEVPLQSTWELARGDSFREVKEARPGDLVLYFDGAHPYHVAVLEQEEVVVSSTLNAGVVRTPIDAFAGARKLMRLVEPLPTPTSTPSLPFGIASPRRVGATATPRPASPSMGSRGAQPTAAPGVARTTNGRRKNAAGERRQGGKHVQKQTDRNRGSGPRSSSVRLRKKTGHGTARGGAGDRGTGSSGGRLGGQELR